LVLQPEKTTETNEFKAEETVQQKAPKKKYDVDKLAKLKLKIFFGTTTGKSQVKLA